MQKYWNMMEDYGAVVTAELEIFENIAIWVVASKCLSNFNRINEIRE